MDRPFTVTYSRYSFQHGAPHEVVCPICLSHHDLSVLRRLHVAGAGAEEVGAATTAPEQQQGSLYWRGDVDGTVDLHIRHRSVRVVVKAGRSLQCLRYRFDGVLPKRNGGVQITKMGGRGTIELIQQPDSANNYTAVVRVTDRGPSREECRFTLVW